MVGKRSKHIFKTTRFLSGWILLSKGGIGCVLDDLDEIEDLTSDHNVEVSCIGWPEYKTLIEIYKEKEYWDAPQVVIGLGDLNTTID